VKAVILAGGLGTRISEETHLRPKPMVEVCGRPIIWHIMKSYSLHGINDFIVCCGYKGYVIKEYFANFHLHQSDFTVNTNTGDISYHDSVDQDQWNVTCVDTGSLTMTGGRLKRIAHLIDDSETFCITYGDGVSDVNIQNLIEFHQSHDGLVTLTAVRPKGRFGVLGLDGNKVHSFREKNTDDCDYVNGGFFVAEKKALEFIDGDDCIWEQGPLNELANTDNLYSFQHNGFWQPMDTLRDRTYLDQLCKNGKTPWLGSYSLHR